MEILKSMFWTRVKSMPKHFVFEINSPWDRICGDFVFGANEDYLFVSYKRMEYKVNFEVVNTYNIKRS